LKCVLRDLRFFLLFRQGDKKRVKKRKKGIAYFRPGVVQQHKNKGSEQFEARKQTEKAMKLTISKYHAADMLRADDYANWSHHGALALVEYLEELEYDCNMDIDFCPVSLRCDYSEYKSLQEFAQEYSEIEGADDEEIRAYIRDNGTLIEFDGGIIVSTF
jgi:hypothetical protein